MSAILVLRDGVEVEINEKVYQGVMTQFRMGANLKMYRTPDGNEMVLTPSKLHTGK